MWASWRDGRAPVALGEHAAVLGEMRAFIAQSETAARLLRRATKPAGS